MKSRTIMIVASIVAGAGCGSQGGTNAHFETAVVIDMHQLLLGQVQAFNQAARELQMSAPTPTGRGWTVADTDTLNKMKNAWGKMRAAWERTEGVLSPLFPDLDASLDTRYDDFLTQLGAVGDTDLFDGQGVTGMHAIERILFAPDTPAEVVARESVLPGYKRAAWPATEAEAHELFTGLLARLVDDSQRLVDAWAPLAIDLDGVFTGLTALMDEQRNKLTLAANHQDESRYSQRTMGDLRDNLAGTRSIYGLFVPWLAAQLDGQAIDSSVQVAFNRLDSTYGTIYGDAIPAPPATWSSTLPSASDQQTPFGRLYVAVFQEVDPSRVGSAVDAMNRVARTLSLPEFVAR